MRAVALPYVLEYHASSDAATTVEIQLKVIAIVSKNATIRLLACLLACLLGHLFVSFNHL